MKQLWLVNKLKNNKWFWIKHIFLISLFAYFAVISIIEPSGLIRYSWHYGIWMPLTTYVVFWEGRKYLTIYKKAFKRILDMDFLIGFSAHVIYITSVIQVFMNLNSPMFTYDQMWEAPAVLILVTNIGHRLESRINKSLLKVYEELEQMRNANAFLVKGNEVIEVKTSSLKIGDIVIVKRGDFVPLDGIVLQDGSFDYSNITGESSPVSVLEGAEVVSGAFNLSEALRIKISKAYSDSTFASIIKSIETVSSSKPKLQLIADRLLKVFVPLILLISFLTFIVWIILVNVTNVSLPWISNPDWQTAFFAWVTVMAIACPCALGIAAPLVYTVSSLVSFQNSILINSSKALEEIDKIKIFAFDKTGTITENKMEVVSLEGDKKFITIAKGLELNTNHPIASAILNLPGKAAKVEAVKTIENGLKGLFEGKEVRIQTNTNNQENLTSIALFVENEIVLTINMKNIIKKHVKEVIKKLHKMNIHTVMITGDNELVAKSIANEVGIDEVFANTKPSEKAEIIKSLQLKGRVAFVGDGFNDSVSVRQANVSLAFASGSKITNSLADISLLDEDFKSILKVLKLGKLNNFFVKSAFFYAFAFNVIAIPVAMLLLVQPWMGAAIMATSDILVAGNAFIYKKVAQRKLRNIKIK